MTAQPDIERLEGLLPCPFCGSMSIDAEGWASLESCGPACDDCGASAGSIEGADNIAAWNTRASDARIGHLEARVAAVSESLKVMERVGTEVYEIDSSTGPQWGRLSFGLLNARATLNQGQAS
ncbi:MAG: hypothetical protein M3R41_05650 [Pseudomonadota bacterium]|nr:hypothetical protein [Pseudomonadota bacterium]